MTLLAVDHVGVSYPGRGCRRRPVEVLRDVTLDIQPGECLGLVGESGSGKTTLGRAILGLTPVARGQIRFDGSPVRRQTPGIQAVFQDPYGSLNPAMSVGDILAEPLIVRGVRRTAAAARIAELLDAVGLPADSAARRPREFSGGQRQRIAIARALALRPRLIVCDEPVSALDLTTQARMLDLLVDIQSQTGVAYLFITHDLAVVRRIAHRVAVMRRGDIVELGDVVEVTTHPRDPYTEHLLLAAPVADPVAQAERRALRRRLA